MAQPKKTKKKVRSITKSQAAKSADLTADKDEASLFTKTSRRAAASSKARSSAAKKSAKTDTGSDEILERTESVFEKEPQIIADTLKKSAERGTRQKSSAFESALSMLDFFIDKAGSKLSPERKKKLDQAKDELHKLFDRPIMRSSLKKSSRTVHESKTH